MKKQNYMLVSVSNNTYSYEFISDNVSPNMFKGCIEEMNFLNVKDGQSCECFLATDKIESFYVNGEEKDFK